MHRKLVLVWTVILVLGAGLTVGRLSARLSNEPEEHVERRGLRAGPASWTQDLGLTPDQQKQMDVIWKDLPQTMRKFGERRRAMDKDRDSATRGLLNGPQLAMYDKIIADYRSQREGLDKERQSLIDDNNQRSRALLTDDQKKIWDDMAAKMRERRGTTMPSTQPASVKNDTANPPGVTEGNKSM